MFSRSVFIQSDATEIEDKIDGALSEMEGKGYTFHTITPPVIDALDMVCIVLIFQRAR